MINFGKIEKKWHKIWEKKGIYKDYKKKKKFYILDMFPYPSGEGLHVGHPRGYIATDVFSRYKMMNGYSILHPMGWDAFGLPAENYALEHRIHPKIAVSKNIKRFKEQLEKFGFTYDWEREINTTDPNYYKWTQWIFLKMFENGLAYESHEPIIWCPSCKTSLALEDLENGRCERCGSEVERKPLRQWVLKMTAYAEKLLSGLKSLDWPESIKEQQRNWIGRSQGAEIEFRIQNSEFRIKVFTSRLDTIFGCTYLVVAPEHPLLKNNELGIRNFEEVKRYIKEASKKTDLMRTDLAKEKTGVEIKGIKAINPFNNEEIPIFVADYVLGHYGTGAVMAVPAHDERDWDFAKKYGLPIKVTIISGHPMSQRTSDVPKIEKAFTEDGVLINSGEFSSLSSKEAREKMAKRLEKKRFGGKKANYKMRDWVFARQRYWGEPFPLIYCESCARRIKSGEYKKGEFTKGELLNPGWIQVPGKDLPVKLPDVKSYEPSGAGESPLINIKTWVHTKCPKCGGVGRRETNTMPQWAGSNWYYIAYIVKKNSKFKIQNSKLLKEWLPVDLYVGGVEHATRHLLYARFWHKFLYDIGAVPTAEPFKKLANQGLILAEDGRKMSKRWKNVINPDDIIKIFGADAIRLYEMFMGPFNQSIAWSSDGIKGVSRFLERIWKFYANIKTSDVLNISTEDGDVNFRASDVQKLDRLLHQTIKKVTEDIENFRFNTAISALMILLNAMEKQSGQLSIVVHQLFLKILAPFAPHLSEELWQQLGHKTSIHLEFWPKYNPKLIKEEEIELIIQVNGKFRARIKTEADIGEEEAKKLALQSEKVKAFIKNKEIKKTIFVKGRLINFVVQK